jgi:hypothetical protein
MSHQYSMCVLRSSRQKEHSNSTSFCLVGTEVCHENFHGTGRTGLVRRIAWDHVFKANTSLVIKYIFRYIGYMVIMYYKIVSIA